MSNRVSFNLRMSVRGGRLDDARTLMGEMLAAAHQEPGTLAYEWFLSADESTCHIQERYADSSAVVTHFVGFKANWAERFLGCFEPKELTVYGDPDAAARADFDAFGAVYLGTLGGFAR